MDTYQHKQIPLPSLTIHEYIRKIALPAGVIGGLVFILYFVTLMLIGMHTHTQLRWFNFLFLIPVVLYTLHTYIETGVSKTYLKAFTLAFVASVVSFLVLGIFMVIYLFFDPAFMNYLYEASYPQLQLHKYSIFLMLVFEGGVGGLIISFVTLQFFKDRIRKAA